MPSRFVDNAKRQSEYTIVQPGGAALSIPSVFSILFRVPVTLNVAISRRLEEFPPVYSSLAQFS